MSQTYTPRRLALAAFTALGLAATSIAGLVGATDTAQAADPTSRVVYSGRLEDAQGRPIGGIFPLTFSFYRTEKGGRPVWTESHFVAVDNGVYAIELGRVKSFPKTLDFSRSWIGVSVTGGKEIVRDRFDSKQAVTPEPTPTPATPPANPTVGAPPQPAKGTYADMAGFAYEAEKAKSADAVGGLTAADLKALVKQASQGSTTGATAKVKLGSAIRYTEAAGGSGGAEFTLQCPPGHVATGIRGRGALMIDQLSVICTPLE